jgi:hypothetical protein
VLSLRDQRECLPWALLPRSQPLRLTQTQGVVRHRGVAPRIAVALDRPKELEGIPAPRVPPLEDVLFIWGKKALACITPSFALGKVGAWRYRTTVQRPMPSCWAIARGDQPWQWNVQTWS